jgi:protein-export membrane protein SecD
MWKTRIIATLILGLGIVIGTSVYQSEQSQAKPFKLGLDLSGGSYLTYRADTSDIGNQDVNDAMASLRDVIERRVNAFGIAEPRVQTETHRIGVDGEEQRLIVELPGVTDLDEAIALIGETPVLEFKVEAQAAELQRIENEVNALLTQDIDVQEEEGQGVAQVTLDTFEQIEALQAQRYVSTELTGRYLESAQLSFSQAGVATGGGLQSQPVVNLSFDREGSVLFEELTRENVGKTIAIFLDGEAISTPLVNTPISGGNAVIEGNFDIEEARTLVGRLNSGALPIPIELISTNTIGPSLGQNAINAGVNAGLLGLLVVSLILLVWYRLPGLIAVVALAIYTAVTLWLFKAIPVTLTSAGITGFIISIGIAVDANILIFERMKEELSKGARIYDAIETGFKRAWASIRDANLSSIISAVILFWFGTPLIKGFALTFGIGILISMLTAVSFTRLMLFSLNNRDKDTKLEKFLYGSGLSTPNKK